MHSWFDVAQVESLIRQYGYPVLTILTVLGNMGIPVPEESVTILAGYAAHEGWLGYGNVLAFCIIAAICGDNLGYLIGRTGGRPMLRRYGHYVGLHHARLEVIERYVNDHGAKTVLLARFFAGMRFFAGPAAGAMRMPFGRFFLFNGIGAAIWVTAMTQVGYHFGPAVIGWIERGNHLALGTLLAIAALVLAARLTRRLRLEPGRRASPRRRLLPRFRRRASASSRTRDAS